MKDGLPEGKGTANSPNGDMYTGSWMAGKREGYGTFITAADHSIYMGEWKDDMKNGKGLLQLNGESREGNWKDGEYIDPTAN